MKYLTAVILGVGLMSGCAEKPIRYASESVFMLEMGDYRSTNRGIELLSQREVSRIEYADGSYGFRNGPWKVFDDDILEKEQR